MGVLDYQYLGQDVLRGFDSYRYSCQDTSPLSKYVMHPFWNLVVKLCPLWVAPNLLTFVGFLCCIGHFAVAAGFDYSYTASTSHANNVSSSSTQELTSGISVTMHAPIPSAAWFVISLLLFLAHTLDGIDGKQARRTGTSSPLGELFDHGCDAWSTFFIATTIYSVFGRNVDGFSIPLFRMYLQLWTVFFMFHFAHVEKYNTGILYLPWAYDLSMIGGTLLYSYVGFMGVEVFKFNVGHLSSGGLAEIIVYLGALMAFSVALYNILLSYKNSTGKMRPFLEAVRPLVSLGIAFLVATLWASLSHNNILERDPRAFFFALGSIYANMSCRLILAQMSNTRCELINYQLVPLTAAAAVSLCVPSLPSTYELLIVYLLAVVVTVAHLHYVICVVRQMCQYLKIECFRIRSYGAERQKDS